MSCIPQSAASALEIFRPCFTQPTFERFLALSLSAIVTTGARTVSNLVRTIGDLAQGHLTTYHHVFSNRRFRPWSLSRALASFLIVRFAPSGVIRLVGDDTVLSHPGRHVFGKGRHRDAVRSSHSYTAFHYGHKWVVLSLLVRFPFASRPWALPVLVALYTDPDWDKKQGRRHKTPPVLMEGLLSTILHWFPDRRFLVSLDGAFGTHRLARFAHRRTHGRLVLISRFYDNAALHKLPVQKRVGRPRVKGKKLPYPKHVVKTTRPTPLTVGWYGGEQRHVEVISGTGHWYKGGQGLVPIRWVHVKDLDGTHRDEYFFTTAVNLTAKKIIECYTGRWAIETTFQEAKAHLQLGSTRCHVENSVLREAPCLFGLYSLVVAIYASLKGRRGFAIKWIGKRDVTFSDALTAVRKYLWRYWVFRQPQFTGTFEKLPLKFQRTLLHALAPPS